MEHLDIVHVQCRELYLPVQYFESNHRYPVVYVQDEASFVLDSYNYVDHLFLTKQLPEIIFVGIKPHERKDEYTPWPAASLVPGGRDFRGGAKTYLQTLVDQIKPYMDHAYRTLPEKESTAFAGCSLGGLVSIYAYYEHAEIFGIRLETDPLGTHDSFFFSIRFIAAMKWLFGEACIQSDVPLR